MMTQSEASRKAQQRTWKWDLGRKKHLEHWESKLKIMGDMSWRQEWNAKNSILQNMEEEAKHSLLFQQYGEK